MSFLLAPIFPTTVSRWVIGLIEVADSGVTRKSLVVAPRCAVSVSGLPGDASMRATSADHVRIVLPVHRGDAVARLQARRSRRMVRHHLIDHGREVRDEHHVRNQRA